jgi:anti-sigma factor RsiW
MANQERVPDWLLERLKAGELSATRAEALRARLRADGEDHRLAKLTESDAEILAALSAAEVVREVERRRAATTPRPMRRRRPLWALPAAAACAAGIALLVSVFHDPGDDVRYKGDEHRPSLRIYRQTQAGPEQLRPNAEVRQGDNLQIRYLAAGKRFGVIASIDGRGTVTLHLPESPGQAAALGRDGERALPHAYQLDDSPRFERFVFITADAPFATDEVARSLRTGVPLSPPLASFEVTLRKSP